MADKNKEKQATCPVCGYTDSAMDADLLEQSMSQHMRDMHNVSWTATPADTDLKATGRDTDSGPIGLAEPPDVPGSVTAPGNNVGTNRQL